MHCLHQRVCGSRAWSEHCCRNSGGPGRSHRHDFLHLGLDHPDADHRRGQAAHHPGLECSTLMQSAPAAHSDNHSVSNAAALEPMLPWFTLTQTTGMRPELTAGHLI